MFKLLHAGFDTIDVAFAGALSDASLRLLEAAREEAGKRLEPVFVNIGPGDVTVAVSGNGMRGGYAFCGDTGPLGAKWFIKKNRDPREWNIFASPRATTLLSLGYDGTRDMLIRELEGMGAKVGGHSVNRADFAMDFRTLGFSPRPEKFVAHSHTKVQSHLSRKEPERDRNQPSSVTRGRRVESVTIGKMPGRQIVVYDKRRESIERRKHYWFKAWGVSKEEPDLEVWRVEVRAGKKELNGRWNIRTFQDLETAFGDMCCLALQQVRYVTDAPGDSNITRQELHPLWLAAQHTAGRDLMAFRSGLTPGQVREVERTEAAERYRALIHGSSIGLAVTLGMDNATLAAELGELTSNSIAKRIAENPERHQKAVDRARQRLSFLIASDT